MKVSNSRVEKTGRHHFNQVINQVIQPGYGKQFIHSKYTERHREDIKQDQLQYQWATASGSLLAADAHISLIP